MIYHFRCPILCHFFLKPFSLCCGKDTHKKNNRGHLLSRLGAIGRVTALTRKNAATVQNTDLTRSNRTTLTSLAPVQINPIVFADKVASMRQRLTPIR